MRKLGFTLVELLIVVAIIGVLSTVGVPTFRKMIQKSRQAEVKTALGTIYRLESGFRSEYATYGTNLDFMGYEVPGQPRIPIFQEVIHCGYYMIGFPINSSCKGSAILPLDYATKMGLDYGKEYYAKWRPPDYAPATNHCRGCALAGANTFEASGNAVLAPVSNKNAAPLEMVDQWSIDHNRVLTHQNDGVR